MRHGLTQYRNGCRCLTCHRAEAEANAKRYERIKRSKVQDWWPCQRARRKLRALLFLGWSETVMAETLGIEVQHVRQLMSWPQPWTVEPSVLDRIDVLYSALEMIPGGDEEATYLARRRHYLPPLAYDDIDNPDDEGDWSYVRAANEPWNLEDIDELRGRGYTLEDIAFRYGTTSGALLKSIFRQTQNVPVAV